MFSTVRYSVVDEASRQYFRVNEETGQLSLTRSLNNDASVLYKVSMTSPCLTRSALASAYFNR